MLLLTVVTPAPSMLQDSILGPLATPTAWCRAAAAHRWGPSLAGEQTTLFATLPNDATTLPEDCSTTSPWIIICVRPSCRYLYLARRLRLTSPSAWLPCPTTQDPYRLAVTAAPSRSTTASPWPPATGQ